MNLLLHLLMLSLLSSGSAEVVKNFQFDCIEFFAKGKSPTILAGDQYRQICQTLDGDEYHFATLYDTHNRIPVYSAYVFEGALSCDRRDKWYIEPQLDDIKAKPNMISEKELIKGLGDHQAVSKDYENSGFDKGHLAPVYHARSQDCADSTFTLTNAAPQVPKFNKGPWRALEKFLADKQLHNCLLQKYTPYVVTGVVPGRRTLNDRVNVPSHFWTAYCCLYKKKCEISEGFIGQNKNNVDIKGRTVEELEKELAELYKVKSFKLFK
ncbi:endonuclease domain-containing 1 protein-like [Danio rerio]|uniref:Endonuclease domain-containing 1 protein-like n=1 Tax=Danio rerio TaxID=7955 RepID=A0A8M3B767_DANRE|nr:endonuclease domain-containing 1 protein-like [Danio rerio]|eukprot:XP_009304673.1 endonuclease domain-containing 1 protein-like [Danio rerio]